MSTSTYEIALPVADEPGEVLKAFHSLLTALGLELGERYDTECTKTHGVNWLASIMAMRGGAHHGKYYLYDPSFVLNEPLRNPTSPTRKCLPAGPAVYNLLEDIVNIRNSWNHYAVEQNLASLEDAVKPIHELATKAQLRLGAAASAMRKRIKGIRNGTWVAQGLVREPLPTIETRPLPDAVTEALVAEEARQVTESLRAREEVVVRPTVGAAWEGAIPARRIRLTKLGDIVDSESAESLRERLSDRANAAISYWASLRPMGDLRLAEDGAVGAYISGVFRLIGYLGPEPQGDAEQIQGFAIVALYRVTESEILDSQSGRSLLAAASVDVAPIIATILAAVPAGGTIRVTNYGDVVRIDDAGKTKVAHVTPEQWFPGQLAL